MEEYHFLIHTPIWGSRSIGLAEHKLANANIIEIDYKDKDGNKVYPHKYYISGNRARNYNKQETKGITLRIIPIDDLEIID